MKVVVVALALSALAFMAACGGDGDSSPTPAPSAEASLRDTLIAPADLPGTWVFERTSETAPTVGCSGSTPRDARTYSAVLREEPSRFQFLIQAVMIVTEGEAADYMASLPCLQDETVVPLSLQAPDGFEVLAFRVPPQQETEYLVTLVFMRRGDTVSYFSLQHLATGDLDLDEVTRIAATKLDAFEPGRLQSESS
jgi:hypothetical protein